MKITNNLCQMGFDGVLIDTPLTGERMVIDVPENTLFDAQILHLSDAVKFSISLNGDNAKCDIKIVYLSNKNNKNLIDIEVIHKHKKTVSNQLVKGVLAGDSRMTFDGVIRIPKDSQKCDGTQNHRAILLSDSASVKATPELEIYADDVKCAHGSAVGPIEKTNLFYLMARGIPEETAKQVLIKAFLSDMLPAEWEEHIEEWMDENV